MNIVCEKCGGKGYLVHRLLWALQKECDKCNGKKVICLNTPLERNTERYKNYNINKRVY